MSGPRAVAPLQYSFIVLPVFQPRPKCVWPAGRNVWWDGRPPRKRETRGESERCGLAGCVVTKGFVSEVVKAPGLNVAFELTVPCCPIVFEQPSAKRGKFRRGERLDLWLDLFDLTHDG